MTTSPPSRFDLATRCLDCAPEAFPEFFTGVVEPIIRKKIVGLSRSGEVAEFAERVMAALREDPKDPRRIVAALMFFSRFELPELALEDIPPWLLDYYLSANQEFPRYFPSTDSHRGFVDFIRQWTLRIDAAQAADDVHPHWRAAAKMYYEGSSFIVPTYFSPSDLTPVCAARGRILRRVLAGQGQGLDHEFPARNASRIRLGVLRPSWEPKTETFATLPVFAELDRSRFEVVLFALEVTDSATERYARTRADRFIVLPWQTDAGAEAIRAADLDLLFFGGNLTAGFDDVALLAAHRLARVQVASICCPVTTGFPSIDYFIAGTLTEPSPDAQACYTEKLVRLEGSGLCFHYGLFPAAADFALSRSHLGIPPQSLVLASGANLFKIVPEVRDTWVEILASIPESRLILYPFGPAWIAHYPFEDFMADMHERLAARGVHPRRLIVLQPFENIADIQKVLGLADLYLDSFPYAGATSLLDPLFAGLPPVTVAGDRLRFAQAGALLAELGLTELVADDAADYVRRVVALAKDPVRRLRLRREIAERMGRRPAFLDAKAFADKLTPVFERMVAERRA